MPVQSRSKLDMYVNRALATVTLTAANTLTFEQLRFAVGVFQGVALVIHGIEWHPSAASVDELAAAADSLTMGLVTNDNLSALVPSDQDVLAHKQIVGIGTNVEPQVVPWKSDFSQLPGGGLIVPANPIYLCATSSGYAAAAVVNVVLYYTFKQLSDKDYIELVQMMIPGNI